ncbi:MAG: serine kinase [Erythrobacter sp.]|nr:serine kinase [Erythrobacter sp.]
MTDQSNTLILQASAVALEGRAILIEGEPGVGKSSLSLALIERGAELIGDDGVNLARQDGFDEVFAMPPPNTKGLIEVRGVGLARMDVAEPTPVGLILTLLGPDDPDGDRLPEWAPKRDILGCRIPVLPFRPGEIAPAERARQALTLHGRR